MELVANATNLEHARNSIQPLEKRPLVAFRVIRTVGSSNQDGHVRESIFSWTTIKLKL
jgi:hypothetical protein